VGGRRRKESGERERNDTLAFNPTRRYVKICASPVFERRYRI
jgi:hypothetical protein